MRVKHFHAIVFAYWQRGVGRVRVGRESTRKSQKICSADSPLFYYQEPKGPKTFQTNTGNTAQFSSVENDICAPEKTRMRSTPSLRSFPNIEYSARMQLKNAGTKTRSTIVTRTMWITIIYIYIHWKYDTACQKATLPHERQQSRNIDMVIVTAVSFYSAVAHRKGWT